MNFSKKTKDYLVNLVGNYDVYSWEGRNIGHIYYNFLTKNKIFVDRNNELRIYDFNKEGLQLLVEDLTNPQNWIEGKIHLSKLVKHLNEYLEFDGYELILKNKKYFLSKTDELSVEISNKGQIDFQQAKEMLIEVDSKIKTNDFGGCISDCLTILEGVFADIYKKRTSEDLGKGGDIRGDFKKISGLLNLIPSKDISDGMKSLTSGLINVISGIDILANGTGKRHRNKNKPTLGQAKLVFNASKTLIDFLYEQ